LSYGVDLEADENTEAGFDGAGDDVWLDAFVIENCCWLELHDVGFVDSEIRERILEGSLGLEDKVRAEKLLAARSKDGLGSWGTSMPRFNAVTRN